MTTPHQTHLTHASQTYSSTFTSGHLPLPPSQKYLILTCMDARIDPSSAFSIPLGAAHVIRNAGASTHDALRSIIISNQLLGTKEILLVKHTDCGMLSFTNLDAYFVVEKSLGPSATAELKARNFDFRPFQELEAAIKEDIAFLKASPLIADNVPISGWIYEVETGKTSRVV